MKNAKNNENRHEPHKYESKVISITNTSISSAKLRYLAQWRNWLDFLKHDETAETRNESHECNSKLVKTIIALVYFINEDTTQSIKTPGVTSPLL